MNDKTFRLGPSVAVLALLFVCAPCPAGQAQADERTMSREEELSKLTAIVRDAPLQASDPDRVVQAIERLGEINAVEAVDDLAGLLTFRKWLPWEKDPNKLKDDIHPISDRDRFPAIRALIMIGPPSLPALIRVIEAHEPDSLETRHAMEAIISLSRYERPGYVKKLKDAAARVSTPEAAQRLLKAAEALKDSKR